MQERQFIQRQMLKQKIRSRLKNVVPNWLKASVRKSVEAIYNSLIYTSGGTANRSFIVTFHKCGSQWFRTIFTSSEMHKTANYRFFTYKLLPAKGYDSRSIMQRQLPSELANGIYGPLYMSYNSFKYLKETDRICLVIRDPRNIICSWYDSVLKSHALMGSVGEIRTLLQAVPLAEGIDVLIDHVASFGTFEAMESWMTEGKSDPRVLFVQFESFFSEKQEQEFILLLEHMGLKWNEAELKRALEASSFQRLSQKNKHYKKGGERSWRTMLNDSQIEKIRTLCPITMEYYA